MARDISGMTAIVTGGAKGYGRGITELLCEKGVRVWMTGRDQAALDEVAAATGAVGIQADVTSSEDWDRVFETVLAEAGSLDILVNNAGAAIRVAPLADLTDDEMKRCVEVNLTGPLLSCRRAAQVMGKAGKGTIINVSSVCQKHAWPTLAVYSAAKAGLGMLSDCLYNELRSQGVRVTTLIPSWGATGFAEAAGLGPKDPEVLEKCIQPRELGEAVVYLCELPDHLVVQDFTLWPMVQEVVPL
jgi:NAD(P)-dependent dehydrogenase (short-subunit alcohol dehydrogenase family)